MNLSKNNPYFFLGIIYVKASLVCYYYYYYHEAKLGVNLINSCSWYKLPLVFLAKYKFIIIIIIFIIIIIIIIFIIITVIIFLFNWFLINN